MTFRRYSLACLIVVGLLMCGVPGQATVHNISIGNFFFSPTNTVVNYGDTVQWTWTGGSHSTTSDVSSAKVWDSGIKSSGTFQIVIVPADGPGPFPYHCTPHAATMRDTIFVAAPAMNSMVNPASAPVSDQNNASVAISEVVPGELYSVFNDFLVPGAIAPSVVNWSFSPAGGAAGTWANAVKPPDAPLGFAEEWNPWISAVPAPAGGYVMVGSQRAVFPWAAAPNGIVANVSPGGGAPFGAGVLIFANVPGVTWVDYPVVEVDDNPASPWPSETHYLWTEFFDATGGDADGNGNPYDDAGDTWTLFTATTNIGGVGGPAYPATTAPFAFLAGLPVWPNSMGSHRGALDVLDVGNPLLGPGAVYVAYRDVVAGVVLVDANLGPGVGGVWGALTGGAGPAVAAGGIPPMPPVIPPGIKVSNNVTIATQPHPVCPGAIFVAWDQIGGTDLEIFFASSFDGGITWTPPVRVNQDPIGNGLDQWAPHMRVDAATGEIVITYFDRRNDPANTLIEVWSSRSPDCGITWLDCMVTRTGPTPPISNTPFPIAPYIGDYLGTDYAPAFGHAYVWNDGRNGVDQDIFFETLVLCDTDTDGIPDSLDNCPFTFNPGQIDSDGDGVGDACDICPGFDDNLDADADGVPDGCDICPGFDDAIDTDADGVPNGCDICPGFDDTIDSDADGVPDGCDICPGFDDAIDTDADGVPNGCDICPGFDDNLDADGDGVPNGCDICPGFDDTIDSDADGVPDGCDICPGFDDYLDADGDGVPNGCDICPGFDDTIDSDADGVPDGCDICPGFDDAIDTDADGVPNGCDICPGFDDNLDADGDGVPNGCDICPGFDDLADGDGDAVPDSCDNCPATFNPSQADTNSNGIGDACESTGCCVGVKGNVDCDPLQNVNLTDLTTLVNSLFVTFTPLCCPDEADLDGNGIVNLTDLTLLVNSLFVTFTPLPPC